VAGENILVIGAGIAGLNAALALSQPGRNVTLIERDPPPPDASPDAAFDIWERRGVGHLRHSHAFLARLYLLIREKYPDLLQALLDAGCRELRFEDGIPNTLRDDYERAPEDDDLTILTSRRTTLEFIMRRYAATLPGMTFMTGTRVKGLRQERATDGTPMITGVTIDNQGQDQTLTADLVIDAGGKNALGMDWLKTSGIQVRQDVEGAGILYYTRHYRLRPGQEEPPRGKLPSAADLGYIKFGIFPADNGCFSITLAVPEVEMELRRRIVHPEVFDTVCRAIPGMEPWIEEERTEPKSKVYGMGELKSQWRHLIENDKPVVLNYFPMGDNLIRTNPLYGRGCSFAAVEAQALARALDATDDPAERARQYHAEVTREVRPYYDSMLKQDRAAIRRAANGLNPNYEAGFKARLAKSFIEDAINIALRSDVDLLREAMHGFHMLSHPDAWLKKPKNFIKVMRVWARGKKRNKAYYLPRIGPNRKEMFELLDLSPTVDWDTYNKAA